MFKFPSIPSMIRFPSDLTFEQPFVFFSAYDATYEGTTNISQAIYLYLPMNFSINDQLAYDTHQGGHLMSAQHLAEGTLSDAASAGYQEAKTLLRRGVIGSIGELAPGANREAAIAMNNLRQGTVTNPNEFLLFKSPHLRTFSFTFEFKPKNQGEVDSMIDIIKEFRKSAYPGLNSTGFSYTIPKFWRIRVGSEGMGYMYIPECACESIQTTYNPTSMSFFKYRGAPSKVNLTISFKELKQLSREDVQQGF